MITEIVKRIQQCVIEWKDLRKLQRRRSAVRPSKEVEIVVEETAEILNAGTQSSKRMAQTS